MYTLRIGTEKNKKTVLCIGAEEDINADHPIDLPEPGNMILLNPRMTDHTRAVISELEEVGFHTKKAFVKWKRGFGGQFRSESRNIETLQSKTDVVLYEKADLSQQLQESDGHGISLIVAQNHLEAIIASLILAGQDMMSSKKTVTPLWGSKSSIESFHLGLDSLH